jgi:hypothetical protein
LRKNERKVPEPKTTANGKAQIGPRPEVAPLSERIRGRELVLFKPGIRWDDKPHVSGFVYGLAYISPRCANGGSCGSSPALEVLYLVAIAGGIVLGVLGWIQQKWNRGPVAWLLAWVRRRRQAREEQPKGASDDPFGH